MELECDASILEETSLITMQFELTENLTGYQLHNLLVLGWVVWAHCDANKSLVWVYDRTKCVQALSVMEKLRCQR